MARGGARATSFKPGKSGNPGGRPKGVTKTEFADVKALARQYTEVAVLTLVKVMENPKSPPAARVSAASAILDRGHGKPPQSLEHTGAAGGPIDVRNVPVTDADRIAAIMALAKKAEAR